MESRVNFIHIVSMLFLLSGSSVVAMEESHLMLDSVRTSADDLDSVISRHPTPSRDVKDITLKKHRYRLRSGYESLKMTGEPDLGMVGIGADLFIEDRLPNFYLTLNSYSAIIGRRPGLISFGTGVGYLQPLFNSSLALDAGVFIGGGGGGGAPDGGGLITRGHLNLAYTWNNISIFGGYSRLDFPTGEMGSNNFNAGITILSSFHTVHQSNSNLIEASGISLERASALRQSKTRGSLLGLQYLELAEGSIQDDQLTEDREIGSIRLIGIELDHFLHRRMYAALKLHGAVTGGIDGYMSYLVGLGVEQPLGTERLLLDAQFLAGPSGGGKVASGGGGTVQGALALRANLSKAYQLKASVGKTLAPGGGLNGTFLELGLSKNFDFQIPADHSLDSLSYRMKKGERLHAFVLEIQNRTYLSPDRPDKSGYQYDRYFNLLGFLLAKRITDNFSILGASYWAYQGSYGAYAEGLLGLEYKYPLTPSFCIRAQVLGGAAGGGGIDVGNGLVFQYNAGLHKTIRRTWGLSLSGGRMQSVEGNFHPFFIDLGVNYQFVFLM